MTEPQHRPPSGTPIFDQLLAEQEQAQCPPDPEADTASPASTSEPELKPDGPAWPLPPPS